MISGASSSRFSLLFAHDLFGAGLHFSGSFVNCAGRRLTETTVLGHLAQPGSVFVHLVSADGLPARFASTDGLPGHFASADGLPARFASADVLPARFASADVRPARFAPAGPFFESFVCASLPVHDERAGRVGAFA